MQLNVQKLAKRSYEVLFPQVGRVAVVVEANGFQKLVAYGKSLDNLQWIHKSYTA
jgi:hypothetical protein